MEKSAWLSASWSHVLYTAPADELADWRGLSGPHLRSPECLAGFASRLWCTASAGSLNSVLVSNQPGSLKQKVLLKRQAGHWPWTRGGSRDGARQRGLCLLVQWYGYGVVGRLTGGLIIIVHVQVLLAWERWVCWVSGCRERLDLVLGLFKLWPCASQLGFAAGSSACDDDSSGNAAWLLLLVGSCVVCMIV